MESYIFEFGIFVTILFLIGVFYTIKEFKVMENNPEDYQREPDHIDTVD
ncbi:MAG: hypothetical protein U5J63_12665 [Fodinibius sp.]|nr:hypothetical protein [Fodinibius sp.]